MKKLNALLLFGSTSDEKTYQALKDNLSPYFNTQLEVCSAHRNPTRLSRILEESDYDFVFAGAGIAAHLPGVVASHIYKPVIGVPIASQLGGLDAFLSIAQMPYGVPVMAMRESNLHSFLNLFENLDKLKENFSSERTINLCYSSHVRGARKEKEIERLKEVAHKLSIKIVENDENSELPKIHYLAEGEVTSQIGLNVFYYDETNIQLPETGLKMFESYNKSGLWLALNNTRNALLSWIEILSSLEQDQKLLEKERQR